MPASLRDRWASAFVACGASQCGFCTPGIVMRLAALGVDGEGGGENGSPGRDGPVARRTTRTDVEAALRAHLCRCTGWQSIVEAACDVLGIEDAGIRVGVGVRLDAGWDRDGNGGGGGTGVPAARDQLLSSWRAEIEGGSQQASGLDVVLGDAGFADDGAPVDALVQLGAEAAPAATVREARARTGRVQGRNSTVALTYPVEVPEGEWALTLQTTWVEPAYLEPDASWSRPDGEPASPLANGGAFGGKRHSPVPTTARRLADAQDRPVRVLWRREDVVRRGPKRPPLAIALRADGSGVVRVGRSPGSDLATAASRTAALCPGVTVEEVEVVGPPVSGELRGAVWAEVMAAQHAVAVSREGTAEPAGSPVDAPDRARHGVRVAVPGQGAAQVVLQRGGSVRDRVAVELWAGQVLDPVTLRSYALGAVHQALGLVWSEGIAVDVSGEPVDLTIRSFGILAARDVPDLTVTPHPDERWPVNGSDAVFVAAMAAAWLGEGLPSRWPTRRAALRAPRRDVAASGRREEQT